MYMDCQSDVEHPSETTMSTAASPISSSTVSELESQQGSSSNYNGNANSVSQAECIVLCVVCVYNAHLISALCFHLQY